jgi:3-methyladenine DNA glycosylase AlkD
MDVAPLIAGLVDELTAAATPERAAGEKRYLKSDLDFIGATVPTIIRATKRLRREHPHLARADVVRLAGGLWERPVHELRMAAVSILELYSSTLQAKDIRLLEKMLRESRTWALVDNLAASVVGPLWDRYPQLGSEIDRWAEDDDFWIRRSALMASLKALRAGGGDFERFCRYADAMLEEREFFIRKAIGWVLRDTSRKRPEMVAAWVGPRTHRMSGVTIREAVKKLPAEQAAAFLAAYKAKMPATNRELLRSGPSGPDKPGTRSMHEPGTHAR